MLTEKDLLNPPCKYRPAPFWSWNEKLDIDTTLNQIDEMKKAGLGGFFMHARGGLQTEYMGEDWFLNVKESVKHGKKNGMHAWGYDENGWPSGFASGKVMETNRKFCQKKLFCEVTKRAVNTENTISNTCIGEKNYHCFYVVNPYYADLLNKDAVKCFIENTHEEYLKRLGTDFSLLSGFFTDEPQINCGGIGWSGEIVKFYKQIYNEDLLPLLPFVFYELDGYKAVRYRFWHTVRELFCTSFMEQVSQWCHDHDCRFTGHMMLENRMVEQLTSNAAVMSMYEYFDIPGIDYLGKTLSPALIPLQVASVAHQLQKKQTVSETFAMCGWNVTFEEMRWNYEWLMVHGITLLCPHLEGYSIRGLRKRDYPASLFTQQPWWNEYKHFNDMVSRIGMLLSEGETNFEILLLHPQESAWIEFNNLDNGKLLKYDEEFADLIDFLDDSFTFYDLGDERIICRYGKVENGKFIIGKQRYKTVIVPSSSCYSRNTLDLLKQFSNEGGKIMFAGDIPTMVEGIPTDEFKRLSSNRRYGKTRLRNALPKSNRNFEIICFDFGKLTATARDFADYTMYYIVNSNEKSVKATFSARGKSVKLFDAETGEIKDIPYRKTGKSISVSTTVYGNNSLILFVSDKEDKNELNPIEEKKEYLTLKNNWDIENQTPNAFTLDFCRCYIDGKCIGQKVPVCDIQEMACEKLRPCDINMLFDFSVRTREIKQLCLMIETPEIFDIKINGKEIKKQIVGTLYDDCFKLIDITEMTESGINTIELHTHFAETDHFYKTFQNAQKCETEKNKLTYTKEIEAVYLVGDFCVQSGEGFSDNGKGISVCDGDFCIMKAKQTLKNGNFVTQGFPFFSGRMTLSQKIICNDTSFKNTYLKFTDKISDIIKIHINGYHVKDIMWQPYEVDVSDYLKTGENLIEIELVGSLRNIFGPHHMKIGEPSGTAPCRFFKNSKIWCNGKNDEWTDFYNFVPFGLYL